MQNKNTKIFGGLLMSAVVATVVLAIGLSEDASAATYIQCQSGVVCNGTSGDDIILGTSGADTIFGKGGNDRILGQGGNDIIHGDGCINNSCEGADVIYGGSGNDIIHHDGKQNWHNAQDYNADEIHCGSGSYDLVYYKPGTSSDDDVLLSGHGCEYKVTADQ